MATKIFYGRFWADITPVRAQEKGRILYWQYRIYETLSDRFETEGVNANLDAARSAAEAQIDRLMAESFGGFGRVA